MDIVTMAKGGRISVIFLLLITDMLSLTVAAILKVPPFAETPSSDLPVSIMKSANDSDNISRGVTKFKCKTFRNDQYVTLEQNGVSLNYFSFINCSQVQGDSFPAKLTKDGYLHVEKNNTFLAPGKFCTDNDDMTITRQCPSTSPSHSVVWKKCCPENQMLSQTNPGTCVNSTPSIFRPKVNGVLQSFSVINLTLANFTCPRGYHLRKLSTNICAARSKSSKAKATALTLIWKALSLSENDDHDDDDGIDTDCNCRFQLSPNGSIVYEVATGVFLRKSHWKILDPARDLYCIDGVKLSTSAACGRHKRSPHRQQSADITNSKAGHYDITQNLIETSDPDCDMHGGKRNKDGDDGSPEFHGAQQASKMSSVLYICIAEDSSADYIYSESIVSKTTLLAVIWLLTCPLLFGAALGNCCMIQRNVHGWVLTCYLLSMCVLNVLSAIVILNVGKSGDMGKSETDLEKGCRPIDFIIKFTYMSTLCWITSVNYGLYRSFCRHALPQPVGLRRFIASIVFSLGFPALSVTVSYYVAYLGTHPTCKDEYCLLFSFNTIPFYTLPKILLILGNFAIFIKTTYTITTLRKEAEEVLRRQAKDHLESFGLFAKLFLLTGSIWILRLVLFVLQLQGLYLSWGGVILEISFSVPEVVFPMIVFHHPEFIKWSWNQSPRVSGLILKVNPFFTVESTPIK